MTTGTTVADLVRRINDRPTPRAVLYVAGGGTEIFPIMLASGGGSATLLAGRIPYGPHDFRAILGCDPGRLVDARAARGLAMAAFRHAQTIRGDLGPDQVFGLGATSKLTRGQADRAGRSHEIHAALQTPSWTWAQSYVLSAGSDRPRQEQINALIILNFIATGKGLPDLVRLGPEVQLIAEERADNVGTGLPDLPLLLDGRRSVVGLDLTTGHPIATESGAPARLLLPGSFRPLHEGHRRMAEVAGSVLGLPCDFELSLFHPEKPPLDYVAISARVKQFAGLSGRLFLTDAPTYVEKARLFPGATFVVGYDTALRIIAPRFYGGPIARDAMLNELEALGARFLIFGRQDESGRFRDFTPETCDHPGVAEFLARNAQFVPESAFRVDISSTVVRDRTGIDYP